MWCDLCCDLCCSNMACLVSSAIYVERRQSTECEIKFVCISIPCIAGLQWCTYLVIYAEKRGELRYIEVYTKVHIGGFILVPGEMFSVWWVEWSCVIPPRYLWGALTSKVYSAATAELCDHICYRRLTRLATTVPRYSDYSWFLPLSI